MSYHGFGGGPEFLSEAVARNRAAMCPMPGCGGQGRWGADATIRYFPGGGVAEASTPARLWHCNICGGKFAVETPEERR